MPFIMSSECLIHIGENHFSTDRCTSRRGLFLAACSAFLVSVCSLASKMCTNIPAGELFFVCSVGMLSVGLSFALYNGDHLFPRGKRRYLLCYSVAGSQAWLASYQAIRLMPLSDEALLIYTSIPFTMFLARVFLKESCGLYEVVACLSVIIGVVLVSQPTLDRKGYPYYFSGVLIALYGSFCDSVNYISLKRLKGVGLGVLLVNLGASSAIISCAAATFESWVVPKNAQSIFTIVSLFVMFEIYYTLAMDTEPAGLIALVEASDIVFAYIWEMIFFKEEYNGLKLCGSAVILAVICSSAFFRKSH